MIKWNFQKRKKKVYKNENRIRIPLFIFFPVVHQRSFFSTSSRIVPDVYEWPGPMDSIFIKPIPQSFHWQPRDLFVWRTTPDSSAAETNLRGTMDGTLLSQACDNTIPESWNRCSVSFAFHLSTSARHVLSLIRLPQVPLLAVNEGKILSNIVFNIRENIGCFIFYWISTN